MRAEYTPGQYHIYLKDGGRTLGWRKKGEGIQNARATPGKARSAGLE